MANRYRSLNTTHVFPTAIRHAIPPKPSSALAQKPTVKLSIYSLTHTGAFSRSPKSAAVSEHTVRAIREREAQDIAERKKKLAIMLANVAELGAERMEETIGKAGLRDAAIGTGIAVDKMLALTGQTPAVQIANIVLPSEEERDERRALHDQLDAIARRLREAQARRRSMTEAGRVRPCSGAAGRFRVRKATV